MSVSSHLQSRPESAGDIEIFRHSASIIHKVVRLNVEGLTHAESLIQPQPAGNCLNWVVGHLLCVYQHVLPMLEQRSVMKAEELLRYERGSSAIKDPGEAVELSQLMAAWDETTERIDAGLTGLASETLDAPAPFSPNGNPNETVRTLLATIFFHQAYHAGQTGILRRIAGKDAALG